MKILVVDDNESDRCLLQKTLERNGYNVQSAENRMAALERVEKHRPDIIITDILMPVVGIPEDKLNKIFDKLYQIDSSRTRKYGGTGMGPAVTKHIIENHKGKIRVESKIGKGSTFHITLPKNPA